MRKRIWSLIVAITMIGSLVTPVMAKEVLPEMKEVLPEIKEEYILNITPETIQGAKFIPVQLLGKTLNAKVEWLAKSKKVVLTKEDEVIEMIAGEYIVNNSGETLISFEVVAAKFNLEAIYNEDVKEIRLIPLLPPVAQFKLLNERYIVGETIAVANESYSEGGELIVDNLWEVNGNNKSIQTKDLNKVVKTLKEGTYNIRLKVKNAKNAWSDWAEQTIIIEAYPKPVITSFAAIELDWAQGANILFEYNAESEMAIEIVESKWTYQKEGNTKVIQAEPVALFEKGIYTVTLQVKDEYGNWSLPATTQIHITDQVEKTELQFKLERLRYGDTLENYDKYSFQNYEPVENFLIERGGPTLLFSNSPETVIQKGVLYSDKVEGETRILYHHRNGIKDSSKNIRLVIAVENNGSEPVTITQTKGSNAGPSEDILHLGQLVTRRYFNSSLGNELVLQPNEKRYLYDTSKTSWPDEETFSGVMEFNSDKVVKVTVAAVDRNFQIKDIGSLPELQRDGVHTRGTFPEANKYYSISIPSDRPSKIMLGQKEDAMDNWIDGYDALTGTTEKNKGNYGVIYELNLNAEEKTGVLFNPRGTSFKGAYQWQNASVYLAPSIGLFKGSQQASIAGVVEKRANKRLFYTLSNGSSGPILFTFIPEGFWADYQIEKKEN